MIIKWIAITLTIGFALLSAYAWWFEFAVGPTHGAGAEVGLLSAVLAVVSVVVAIRVDRMNRR